MDELATRDDWLNQRKTDLEGAGYAVLRRKSYEDLTRRVLKTEVALEYEQKATERFMEAANTLSRENDELRAQVMFLYGKAIEHGATRDELKEGQ